MGTRAVITFIDERDKFHIYKHWDGYPSGVLDGLADSFQYAWRLPRFEAMDFAAAYIRGNKAEGGGDVYVTKNYSAHGDLEYRYEVRAAGYKLKVDIFYNTYSEKKQWKRQGTFLIDENFDSKEHEDELEA